MFTGSSADFVEISPNKDAEKTLVECLDTDNGLADYLFSQQVLSAEQYNEFNNGSIWKSYQHQNRSLMVTIFPGGITSSTADMERIFIDALNISCQGHIVNYLQSIKAGEFFVQ